MKISVLAGIAAVAVAGLLAFKFLVATTPATAQECTFSKPADELSEAQVDQLYNCVKDELAKRYAKGGHEIGSNYRTWKVTSTRPGLPGMHGKRFLNTFANEIAFDTYVKYADENVKMPVGSILAKESFKLNKQGKPAYGPLFIMTKLDAGKAAKYGDWKYTAVNPKGKEFKVSQKFCHNCHSNFEDQDALGYPLEEVRLK